MQNLTLIADEWANTVVLILVVLESSATQSETSQWEGELGTVQITFVFHYVAWHKGFALWAQTSEWSRDYTSD